MQTGIHIGTIVGKESLEPLTESILKILDSKADQKTIRFALGLIGRAAEVHNCTISNVTVGDQTHVHGAHESETSAEAFVGDDQPY